MEVSERDRRELLGVVEDVHDFVERAEGLPQYISRQQLIQELNRVIESSSFNDDKRAEVISLSWELANQAKSVSEASACLDMSLPAVIKQIGSRHRDRQQATVRFLQECLLHRQFCSQVIGHLARNGITNRRAHVSNESMKVVPGLYLPHLIHDINIRPIIGALFDQLEDKDRSQEAFASLLRHKEALKDKAFKDVMEDAEVPVAQERRFNDMCNDYGDDIEHHVARRRPKDGASFGLIPNVVVNRLLDKTNRQERVTGSMELKRILLENDDDNIGLLLPYLHSFLRFLGDLLYDQNPKVLLNILGCHEILLEAAPTTMKQHMEQATFNLLKISLDSKPQIKIELYKLMKIIMKSWKPMNVIDLLLDELDHKNPKMREDIIIYVIFALLQFPGGDFDLSDIASRITPSISDPKRRVRQASLEVMAVIATSLGPNRIEMLYEAVNAVELNNYDTQDDVMAAVKARLARKMLPKVNEDGFVEYGLIIPNNQFQKNPAAKIDNNRRRNNRNGGNNILEGADIDWIMKGTGGLSKGTSATNSAGLGVGSGGSLGSSVSLQSQRSSQGETRDREFRRARSAEYNPPPQRVSGRSQSLNRQSKVPQINSQRSREKVLEGEADHGYEYDDEEILALWKDDRDRAFTEKERQDREDKYDTRTKRESMLDLRAAAATPPFQRRKKSLNSIREEDFEEGEQQRGGNGQSARGGGGDPGLKKCSLIYLNLGRNYEYKTLFDEDENLSDDQIAGMFKKPEEAYEMALKDMKSKEWKTEIDGLDAIVRITKYHPDIIIDDIKHVLGALLHECKNLRSQVTRAAIQTLVQMFIQLGRAMELNKVLEELAHLMMTKTADTNRFIRRDANMALEALSEHIAVHRAVTTLVSAGLGHKSTAAKATLARLLADVTEAVGSQRLMEKKEEATLECLLNAGIKLILDGSQDTRKEAKRLFAVLIGHAEFEAKLKKHVKNKKDVGHARKALNSIGKGGGGGGGKGQRGRK